MTPRARGPFFSLPNGISLLRLFSTVPVVLLIEQERFLWALVIFILAGLTDFLDGFLARLLRQESAWGMILDPLADKVLLTACFVTLGVMDLLPLWLVVLCVGRDLLILCGIGLIKMLEPALKKGVSPFVSMQDFTPLGVGKLSTVFQILLVVTCLGVYAYDNFSMSFLILLQCLIAVTALTTLVSGFFYVQRGVRMMRHG